jgi:uncharacterized protein DUF4919
MAFERHWKTLKILRHLAVVAALLVMTASLARPAATAAKPQDPAARYQELIVQVRKGNLNVDFQELRYAYAESSGYRPYIGPTEPLVGAMFRAYKAQDFDGAIAAAKKVLAINYLDIDAHIVCDLSYRLLSNTISAEPYHEMASRLLQSIFASGDGNSTASAYQVIAVREEYSVLNAMNLSPGGQRSVTEGEHRFDAFDIVDRDSGAKRTIYFNIDRPMRWLDRHGVTPDGKPNR